jgi:hypothetical protein
MRPLTALGALIALCCGSAAWATETITYTYDAQGRLVAVVHSGSVNNGLNTTYSNDPADNRVTVMTTGH